MNGQSGQFLRAMKETGLGVVTQEPFNRNVRSIKSTQKSSYKKYTSKRRFQIAQYINETGCSTAAQKFKSLLPDLSKSMVHGFWKKYLDQLKLAEKRTKSLEKLINNIQSGSPILLGSDIDEKVSKYIIALRYKGRQAVFSTAIAIAKALIEKGNNEKLKVFIIGKDWVQNLLR